MKFRLLLTTSLLLLAGCSFVTYKDATSSFSRRSFLNTTKFTRMEKGTNGFVMEGYINDQVEGAAKVAGAVAEGLAKGAKP